MVYPKPLASLKKTDWNDVLLIKGMSEVQNQLTENSLRSSLNYIDGLNNKVIEKSIVSLDSHNNESHALPEIKQHMSNFEKPSIKQIIQEIEI